jgi:hypothetical protein
MHAAAALPSPRPARMPRWERIGPDLIHIIPARRLALDDPADTLDGVCVIYPLSLTADSEHRGSLRYGCRGRQRNR